MPLDSWLPALWRGRLDTVEDEFRFKHELGMCEGCWEGFPMTHTSRPRLRRIL